MVKGVGILGSSDGLGSGKGGVDLCIRCGCQPELCSAWFPEAVGQIGEGLSAFMGLGLKLNEV